MSARHLKDQPINKDQPAREKLPPGEVAPHIQRLVEQYRKELMSQFGKAQEGMTLEAIEAAACNIKAGVGEAIAQEMTQAQVDLVHAQELTQPSQKAQCRHCQQGKPYRCTAARTIVTLAGEVRVVRRGYYCRRCDQTTFPVDARLHLPHHAFTAVVEQKVARFCVKESYVEGMKDLEALTGVRVSPKEAQRITLAVGEWVQSRMAEDIARVLPPHARSPHLRGCHPEVLGEPIYDPSKTGYLLLDGVMTPMQDGSYRESKIGNVVVIDERKKRAGKEEGQVITTLYSHTLEGPQAAGEQLYALAARAGVTGMSRLVALGDGAVWIWNQIRSHFPQAIQILDWRHAQEHLHSVAKACLGTGGPPLGEGHPRGSPVEGTAGPEPPISTWVKEVEALMWKGEVSAVIQRVQQLPAPDEKARECIRETVTYYQNNHSRMKYEQYRAKGFSIGSGRIESGCKQIVQARMKGAGMRWSERGAKAMGCLRALFLSYRRWNDLIPQWPGRSSAPVPIS